MCAPVAVALGALSLGTQVAGTLTARSGAKKNAKAEAAAAARAFSQTAGDIEARRTEEQRASKLTALQMKTISAQEKGQVQAMTAENGVSGQSVDALQGQFDRALSIALGANAEDLRLTEKQLDREIDGAASGAQSRINQAKSAVPSGLSTAVALGGAAVGTFSDLYIQSRKK